MPAPFDRSSHRWRHGVSGAGPFGPSCSGPRDIGSTLRSMSETPRPKDFGIGRLFEHVKDAVVVADAATERILLWNQGAHEMFGYEEEEALAMPLHRLVSP